MLDTNVVSELMRTDPEPAVLAWVATHRLADLAVTAITLTEIRYGIIRLPAGRRRDQLGIRFHAFLEHGFGGQTLPFDTAAGEACAATRARRQQEGVPP